MDDGLTEAMRQYKQEEEERKNKNKSSLYEELQKYPQIAKIVVDYDGQGDDGNIDGIICYSPDGQEEKIDPVTEDAISDYVYSTLPGGWEINDGSFGTCTIDVLNQKAHFDHNDRYMESTENPFED